MVVPARLKRRHYGLLLSLVFVIVLPLFLTVGYLYVFAEDQYASNTGFTVRTEETSSASDLVGGLSNFMGGGGGTSNTDVLYEFMQSQEIVERVNARIDLAEHYSQTWPGDPVFSIWPDASVEDLLWYWRRMVRISYDKNSGLVDMQVRARDPQTAQLIARAIVEESEQMINALNEAARRDTTANAARDLDEALTRLRASREALAEYRARTQIVDPMADIQARMGVLTNLQQQLAQALVDLDLLLPSVTSDSDPRLRQAQRRIEVIRDRITDERRNFATQDVTVFDTDYPHLIAQFESLRVDQEFAEGTYRAALTALDSARSNAARQSLYLATYIRPTLASRADYPQRLVLSGLTAMFLVLIWSIMALIYYSIRDRG
ncbi:MAG: sugar transporter [Pararhodobacter sp.]|nr:sugar transporter [Pararhodobacter sp.]